jgi:DNA polymerase-3 subunit epsilon
LGACEGKEKPEFYNARVMEAIRPWLFQSQNFFILENIRNTDEVAVVKISQGKYIGYGFLSGNISKADWETLHDCIRKKKDNWDTRIIIKSYLKKYHRYLKIIEY